MALIGSPDVGFVILEGRRLDNVTTAMAHHVEQILEDTTPVGVGDETHYPVGQFLWDASIEGFYNTGTGLAQEGLELTGNQILMYALAGNAIGDPFTGIDGPHGTIATLMERGRLHRIKADFKANFGPEDMAQSIVSFPRNGLVQAGLQIVTDVGPTNLATLDWNTWSADYIDQETGSAIGFIGITDVDIDGAGNILFEIQDSANDIAYANAIVFTVALTDGITGEMVALAAAVAPGDIERYTQLQYEFQGVSGASRTCTFACGLVRTLT